MGKCNNCGKKIKYNQFKRYRKQILCYDCYATRLERKAEKRLLAEENLPTEEELEKTTKAMNLTLDLKEDENNADAE